MDRDISASLKGGALLLMFVHHFFLFPQWYIPEVSYPEILPLVRFFQNPTKICVVLFAFLTGYFYYFTQEKSIWYSLKKIAKLLIPYWSVLMILLVFARALDCCQMSIPMLLAELIGQGTQIMNFCWYVSFYGVSMLMLPGLMKLSTDTLSGDLLMILILPVILLTGAQGILENEFGMTQGLLLKIVSEVKEWFPCISVGFLIAKYDVFETYLDTLTCKIHTKMCKISFWVLLCILAFFGRVVCLWFQLGRIYVCGRWVEILFTMDIVYAPLFVYGATNILRSIKFDLIQKQLGAIGKQSMLMWFFHCVFFNCCKEYTQPVLYFLKNPLLVLVFGTVLCYLAAVLTEKLLKLIRKPANVSV